MKKFLLILSINLIIGSTGYCRGDYNSFYQENRYNEDIINFEIPRWLFRLMLIADRQDNYEDKKFLRKINNVSFFIAESSGLKYYNELTGSLSGRKYRTLVEIKDGPTNISFIAKGSRNAVNKILMIVYDIDDLVVMCIEGRFTNKDAESLIRSVNIDDAVNMR